MKTEETIAHDIEWRWASHIQETGTMSIGEG